MTYEQEQILANMAADALAEARMLGNAHEDFSRAASDPRRDAEFFGAMAAMARIGERGAFEMAGVLGSASLAARKKREGK